MVVSDEDGLNGGSFDEDFASAVGVIAELCLGLKLSQSSE
jgi:hypothetical protein